MYHNNISALAAYAESRMATFRTMPTKLFVSSLLAGAYIGMAVVLMLILGSEVALEWKKLFMSATFGIALVLVIFAGADLFTGYPLYFTAQLFEKPSATNANHIFSVVLLASFVWFGNLVGSLVLTGLYTLGDGPLMKIANSVLISVAEAKASKSSLQLFANGILCNWLVCLAIWLAYRMKSETAKILVIFVCIFAFVASGYEHCVANMSIFALALFEGSSQLVSFTSASNNLLWVTLGNIVGGALFVGATYGYIRNQPIKVN